MQSCHHDGTTKQHTHWWQSLLLHIPCSTFSCLISIWWRSVWCDERCIFIHFSCFAHLRFWNEFYLVLSLESNQVTAHIFLHRSFITCFSTALSHCVLFALHVSNSYLPVASRLVVLPFLFRCLLQFKLFFSFQLIFVLLLQNSTFIFVEFFI